MPSKCHSDGYVAGVAAATNHDPTDPAGVVASIKSVPPVAQKHFEPSAKIHRIRTWRNPDIAQITRYVTRRKIEATAQRDRQVSKVAANTDPFTKSVKSRAVGSRLHVVKPDMPVDKVANPLHALPTERP